MKAESKNYLDQALSNLNKMMEQSKVELDEALAKMTSEERKQFDEMQAKINKKITGFADISELINSIK